MRPSSSRPRSREIFASRNTRRPRTGLRGTPRSSSSRTIPAAAGSRYHCQGGFHRAGLPAGALQDGSRTQSGNACSGRTGNSSTGGIRQDRFPKRLHLLYAVSREAGLGHHHPQKPGSDLRPGDHRPGPGRVREWTTVHRSAAAAHSTALSQNAPSDPTTSSRTGASSPSVRREQLLHRLDESTGWNVNQSSKI